MSGREWKPGDVAAWDIDGDTEVIYRFMGGPDFDIPEWQTAHNGCGYPRDRNVRPLVVIDPEDSEQVERLRDFYLDEGVPRRRWQVDHMQAALRSLIEPPKPPEPTGVGAVVEDVDGRTHVRVRNIENEWAGQDGLWRVWRNIAAVKVLSPGVSDA